MPLSLLRAPHTDTASVHSATHTCLLSPCPVPRTVLDAPSTTEVCPVALDVSCEALSLLCWVSGLLIIPSSVLQAPWGQACVVFSSVSPVSSVGGTGWMLSAGMMLLGKASLWEPAALKFPEGLKQGSRSGSLIPRLRNPG